MLTLLGAGTNRGSTSIMTIERELGEEIGLHSKDVKILASTRRWLRYRLPKRLVRQHSKPLCIGQKQKWFLIQAIGNDSQININTTIPEFNKWKWVAPNILPKIIVPFKKELYQLVIQEFTNYL